MAADRFIVVTGGPGSGKTSLIDALQAQGYARSIEAGRAIIQDQMMIDGPALPWKDPELFAEAMLIWEMRSYRMAQSMAGPVIFDRGVPDAIGYLRLLNRPIPSHFHEAARQFRYNPTVFIAPPWAEIFTQDRERKQSFEEACRTFEAMVAVYSACGYSLVELPLAPVQERLSFLKSHLKQP